MVETPPTRLTPRQRQVLAFVTDFTTRNGAPPTVREIAAGLGIASTNAVSGHLDALARAGALESEGKSVSVVLSGRETIGLIALRDEPRADAIAGIQNGKAPV